MSGSEVYEMLPELERRRRAVKVMDLLTESRSLWDVGDRERSRALMDEATGFYPEACAGIMGGWTIGEVPRPGTLEWDEYVWINRAALDELEERSDVR